MPGPPVSGLDLALLAHQNVPLPELQLVLNPDAGIDQLVGLDTWFWATDPSTTTTQATAEIAGWWSTATATPTTLTIDPGDGTDPIECHDTDTRYDTNRPARNQHSNCTHTWTWSGNTTITATLTWNVTYDSNVPGTTTGTLPNLTTTATIPAHIIEAQPVLRD